MNSQKILERIQEWAGRERECLVEVIQGLMEIDRNQGYRELGYSSLFVMCTEGIGYSEGAAQRRIKAARCAERFPVVLSKIREGKVTLSALCLVADELTEDNHLEILERVSGKSKSQIELLVASLQAPVEAPIPLKAARVTPVRVVRKEAPLPLFTESVEPPPPVETQYTISMQVDEEFMELYQEAERLAGHPGIPMQELLRAGLKALTAKAAPPKTAAPPTESHSRYIPKLVKHQVRERDNNQCSYVSPQGKRCTATHALQFDHINPHCRGGTNSVQNIRLLCPAHNRFEAKRLFGKFTANHDRSGQCHLPS